MSKLTGPYILQDVLQKYNLPFQVKKKGWSENFCFRVEGLQENTVRGTYLSNGNPSSYQSYKIKLSDEILLFNEMLLKKKIPIPSKTQPIPHSPDSLEEPVAIPYSQKITDPTLYNFGDIKCYGEAKEYEPDKPINLSMRNAIIAGYSDKVNSQKEDADYLKTQKSECFARMDVDTAFYPYKHQFEQHYHTRVYLSEHPIGHYELLAQQTVWQIEAGLYILKHPEVYRAGYNYDEYWDTDLVIDWRSPLASLYYDTENTELTRKSTYIYQHNLMLKRRLEEDRFTDFYVAGIREGTDKGSFDPFLINVLDERKSSHELANIIQTIQANQNAIIRKPLDSNIIVQGCAGSGKTMILLHRISYLVFNNPSIEHRNYEIITPNKLFDTHIDGLAKQLELENIKRRTPSEFYLDLLSCYDNEFLSLEQENPVNKQSVSSFIFSDNFIKIIDESMDEICAQYRNQVSQKFSLRKLWLINEKHHLNIPVPELSPDNEVKKQTVQSSFLASVLKRLKEEKQFVDNIKAIEERKKKDEAVICTILEKTGNFKELERSYGQVGELKSWLLNYLWNKQKEYQKLSFLIELSPLEKEFLSRPIAVTEKTSFNYIKEFVEAFGVSKESIIGDYLKRNIGTETSPETYDEKISKCILSAKEHGFDSVASASQAEISDTIKEIENFINAKVEVPYASMFKSFYEKTICFQYGSDAFGYSRSTFYAALLFCKKVSAFLQEKPIRPLRSVTGKYLSIDEAQDFSQAELSMINSLIGDYAVFNFYGDTCQTLHPYCLSSWKQVPGYDKFDYCEIKENYRNTVRITSYCNEKLHRKDLAIGNLGSDVMEISNDEFLSHFPASKAKDNRCAIIIKDTSIQWINNLTQYKGCLAIDKIEPGKISLLSVERSKGLEFDTVYVYDENMTENERYIAYTRALSALTVISSIQKSAETVSDLQPALQKESSSETKPPKLEKQDKAESKVSTVQNQEKYKFSKGYFDNNKIHKITGTEYDPNGFNYYHIHRQTHTKYDPEGIDYLGNPDPNDNFDYNAKPLPEKKGCFDWGSTYYLSNDNKYYYGGDK